MFAILGQFLEFSAEPFGWPVDVESGVFEAGCPSEINLDITSRFRSEQVETTRISPVGPLGWRKLRWLNRRGIVAFPARLGPSSGSASLGIDCGGPRVRGFRRALRHCVDDVDADVLVD